MRSKSLGTSLLGVAYLLILVWTGLGLLMMPGLVGEEWPGWSSTMALVVIVVLPTAAMLLSVSAGAGRFARWLAVAALGALFLKLLWSLYHEGPVILLAMLPVLVILALAALLLAYSWPKATTSGLQDVAHRNGWQLFRESPSELKLPLLPLPVGRAVVRNVVQAATGVAFEVRWLEWHGVLCRRRRLAVFVATLPAALPPLEVRPGTGLVRSDLSLESAEFNRNFDVLGDDSRYLMAVLHPRTMQALLDARPFTLTIAGTALVMSHDEALSGETLLRGLAALERIDVPQHVFDQWGSRAPQPQPGVRFAGARFNPSVGAGFLRLISLATGLLALTLAGCLAAAAAEAPFETARPVAVLLITLALLTLASVGCAVGARPRGPVYGSALA
ncbi:hypothetical protein [Kribbella ginsengisoli]|uniref:Uncharacterized protein n=1 Tax=Kribbella ginsengisoli TaxID=363865 RepID=A0ABP6XFK5_9ACTN